MKDDLVGNFKIPFFEIKEKSLPARWGNLYGPPLSATGPHAELMSLYGSEMGSHYRGRILYQITSQFNTDPKTVKEDIKYFFPEKAIPNAPQRTYILRVDILEGHELPDREQAIVHIAIGPYCIKTQPKKV